MSETVQTITTEAEWGVEDGATWSDDEFSDPDVDKKSPEEENAQNAKTVSKVLADSNRNLLPTPKINTGAEMNNENVYVIHAAKSETTEMEENSADDETLDKIFSSKEKVDDIIVIDDSINDEPEQQKDPEPSKDEVILIADDDDDKVADAPVSKRKFSECDLVISDSDHEPEKTEEETKPDEILFVVDEFEEYEALKGSNMLAQKRLKALLANQHFYVEDEYHIFDETDSCPAIKVNNFILKIIPNVFPENYKPITKSEKPKVQDKPIEVDMIVIENDKEYQQRSPSGYPQFRDIALRRRLADMLKRNEFSIDGEYHVFQKTQKFPVLKIKTSLISHFCYKITGDEPAAKKKKVIAKEEDSEDEFLVTSFYEDIEMDIDDRKSLPDASEIEIQEEESNNAPDDAGFNAQNSAHESLENIQALIIDEHA